MLEQTCGLHYSNTDKKTYKQWFEKNSHGKSKRSLEINIYAICNITDK